MFDTVCKYSKLKFSGEGRFLLKHPKRTETALDYLKKLSVKELRWVIQGRLCLAPELGKKILNYLSVENEYLVLKSDYFTPGDLGVIEHLVYYFRRLNYRYDSEVGWSFKFKFPKGKRMVYLENIYRGILIDYSYIDDSCHLKRINCRKGK